MEPKLKELYAEKLKEKYKHFDFQFTDKEIDYFMENARLTKEEKEILKLRREEESITAIAYKLNTCESNINKKIRKIKNKIILCIVFG
jgi:DNA-binding NarL/FixJ family response regulator